MEKKNNCVKVEFSKVLCCFMAILLYAVPCVAVVEVPAGEEWDIPGDAGPTINDTVSVYGTANILAGAHITQELGAFPCSTLNIYGGQVDWWLATYTSGDPTENPNVTVYGTAFSLDDVPLDPLATEFTPDPAGSVLTGTYENGDPINLLFYSDIAINLAAPGGESITVNIEKAKVSWDHNDIHVYGKLYLPQGFWMDTLDPVGGVVTTLAGIEVANQSVAFAIKGKDGHKWEYKDKENLDGPIKEFKIDWKGAKFDYKGDEGLHIHTHHIGGTETTLCIHCDKISEAFTVSVNGTTIAYDVDRIITTGVEYESQKDDNTHVHFTLPFQLSPDMTIEVSGAVELIIAVADYYEEGFVKFKLKSVFDSGLFPDGPGTSPDKLECVISLGDEISGSDLIGAEKSWTKKDDKHWDYKW